MKWYETLAFWAFALVALGNGIMEGFPVFTGLTLGVLFFAGMRYERAHPNSNA